MNLELTLEQKMIQKMVREFTENEVKPIAAAYGVERVYLFGSYARGEATAESDLDFRIAKGKVKGFAFGGLINALLDAFGKNVDVVTTASLDREFLQEIAGEEVLLYA